MSSPRAFTALGGETVYEGRIENERIEVVRWPLAELERAIAGCEDAKTLIGLMWLARKLNVPLHRQGGTGAGAKP